MKVNLKILKAINQVIGRLNILRRWTGFVTEDKYNELSKQAFNCLIAFMLASFCEENGQSIKWERFPKIAIYRAFQKVYVYFDTPERITVEICNIGGIKENVFDDVTQDIIEEKTEADFAEFISECIGTQEMRIYKAARRIATYVELVENQFKMNERDEYLPKVQEVFKSLEEFSDLPGIEEFTDVHSSLFELLLKISKLRNQNRWSVMNYTTECSVLGHLFDTGMFAYFISLDENPTDEKRAAMMFFMGIFHDIAEVWTTDIPSPIKDRIPGFRKATEEYELRVIEEKLYKKVPDFLAKKLQTVMFEDESNAQFKKLMKGADYLSADSECWRQYIGGSRDPYFLGAMKRNNRKLEEGLIDMGSVGAELHKYFVKYSMSLGLEPDEDF